MKSVLFVLFPVFISFQVGAEEAAKEANSPEPSLVDTAETKPAAPTEGPHKGSLVSAGGFQMEILWESDSSVKIYLLDADYKNETVQNSEVGVFIQSGNTESELSCQTVENYFECKQGSKKFKKGQLSISAKRNGTQAQEVKVKVPFEKKAEDKKVKEPKKK